MPEHGGEKRTVNTGSPWREETKMGLGRRQRWGWREGQRADVKALV